VRFVSHTGLLRHADETRLEEKTSADARAGRTFAGRWYRTGAGPMNFSARNNLMNKIKKISVAFELLDESSRWSPPIRFRHASNLPGARTALSASSWTGLGKSLSKPFSSQVFIRLGAMLLAVTLSW